MKKQIFNPIFPENEYIADGEAHVFGNRIYVYGSHDKFNGEQFCMENYTVWSAAINDLSDWTCHGVTYNKLQDPYSGEDGLMLAPDCVQGIDGRYYLYYTLASKPFVSVAVSEKPEGPFTYYGIVKYPSGVFAGMRENDVFMFDPAVFRDADDQIYLYCGFSPRRDEENPFAEAMKKYRMDGCYAFSLAEDMLTIIEENGKICEDDYFEAPSMRKFEGSYYFIYSSKAQHELKWCRGNSPTAHFQSRGVLISNGDLGLSEKRLNYTGNNHGTVECINGTYYVFYHRQTNRNNYSRQACAERIYLENGIFQQAELTSCGLNGKPLKREGTYSASIACNLYAKEGAVQYGVAETPGIEEHPYFTQNIDGIQYIANMREGTTAVYKYFEFANETRIEVKHTGNGRMEIEEKNGIITFVYHGTDAANFYSFTFVNEVNYRNPKCTPEERAEDLLRKLSLDEKMAQIVGMICKPVQSEQELEGLKKVYPHGAGQISALPFSALCDIHEVKKQQRMLQNMVMELSEHHIPAVFHMEGLCGATLPGGATFASGIGRGASFDPELEEKIGEITARQELAAGLTQVLCPVLDVARDPRHGRHGEAYGEDPTLAACMGTAHIRGQQSNELGGLKAAACGKHYMAYHMSAGGINCGHIEIGPRQLREIHGKPFQAAIKKAGLRTVMPCYDASDDGPVSASSELLTTILRDEMGLQGTAISDYGAVRNTHTNHCIGESLEDAGYQCLAAGMDVELPAPTGYGEALKNMFVEGKADIEVLDRAVRRVLIEKFRMGLFDNPFGLTEEELDQAYQNVEDQSVSLTSARESMVLLKNDGVLPMKRDIKKIAVIGPQANWANYYFGGYTRLTGLETAAAAATSMAGFEENDADNQNHAVMIPGTEVQFCETEVFGELLKDNYPECQTLVEYLTKELPDVEVSYAHGYHVIGDNRDEYEEALQICEGADLILLTLGGKTAAGSIATIGEGVDSADINLPPCQDNFIKEASKLGIPMVGIHFDGRPISSDTADEYLNGIIEAWNPGPFGAQAVTEVLLGNTNPSGKMPVTTARCAGQIPVYYNHPNGSCWHSGESVGFQNYVGLSHKPRYVFGYGLSYTTFEYSNLTVNGSEEEIQVNPKDSVTISFTIRNTGKVKGTEIVQLYLRDPYASMLRPVQELAGFQRVELEPGESRDISFHVEPSQTAFMTKEMKWKIEKGRIEVAIGSSSEEQPLKGAFFIKEDCYIDGRDREFYAAI